MWKGPVNGWERASQLPVRAWLLYYRLWGSNLVYTTCPQHIQQQTIKPYQMDRPHLESVFSRTVNCHSMIGTCPMGVENVNLVYTRCHQHVQQSKSLADSSLTKWTDYWKGPVNSRERASRLRGCNWLLYYRVRICQFGVYYMLLAPTIAQISD